MPLLSNGLRRLFKGKPNQPTGWVKLFGLEHWWQDELNESDRQAVRSVDPEFDNANIISSGANPAWMLLGIAIQLRKRSRSTSLRLIAKGEELAGAGNAVIQHFFYSELIRFYYPDRDAISGALESAIRTCQRQIAISPKVIAAMQRDDPKLGAPGAISHRGYKQLAIIYEKQDRFRDARSVAAQAKEAGWAGDWDNRIARLEKKIAKTDDQGEA
ncbi:MAG: hypothetical protein VX796_05760 [Pseudomonadota bacterium]|nr:hypothetical protein [Pseudomonadota bacterium]